MTQLAQIQTNAPLHFTKPFILVTRIGENLTNDSYHNPYQKYYEHDSMNQLFKHAAMMRSDEKPISALRIKRVDVVPEGHEYDFLFADRSEYFHNFTAALDEYKRGIRVDM